MLSFLTPSFRPSWGPFPAGWATRRLGDVLRLEKGLSYKGAYLGSSGVPMITLGCFLGGGRFAANSIKDYGGEFQKRHAVAPGDLVVANTDITQKREVLGSPALIPVMRMATQLIFSHHVFAVRFLETNERWRRFVYFLLLQEAFRERARGYATGTTVLALPQDAVLNLRFAAPSDKLIDAFDNTAGPLIERQWSSDEEARFLVELRAQLLARLISGDVRVRGAIPALSAAGLT